MIRRFLFVVLFVASTAQAYVAVFGRADDGKQPTCNCAETGVCPCGDKCACDNCPVHQ